MALVSLLSLLTALTVNNINNINAADSKNLRTKHSRGAYRLCTGEDAKTTYTYHGVMGFSDILQ